MRINYNKVSAWMIGIGIVLFAIHNPYQPLIEYLFLPQLGMFLFIIGLMFYFANNYNKITLGDKRIWIPLLVIVASIIGSSLVQIITTDMTLIEGFAPMVFGIMLFLLYIVARTGDTTIFSPFIYAVVIGSLGCVVWGIVNPGTLSGGYVISPTNYDIATGLLVFGTVVSALNRQWWLSAIAITGLLFTGSPEAYFTLAVLGIVVLVRRDWSKKILLPAAVLAVLLILTTVGWQHAQGTLAYTTDKLETAITAETEHTIDEALTGRWGRIKLAMSNIQPLGEGYTIDRFTTYTVHNVPLVIVQQVGILAAIAWLWVTVFCLIKTKWKYAWTAVIALSVFDHFIWTQVAPWWWALVGVSTASTMRSDLIFRGNT